MNSCRNMTSQNVLRNSISPGKMKTETKYKKDKLAEIISAVCALFNSGGGKLELYNPENNTSKKNVNDCVKTIEQLLIEMVGTVIMASHINVMVNCQEVVISVQQSRKLISVNYNLYLPCETQVNVVQVTTTSVEEMREMFQTKIVEDSVLIGSHVKRFVKAENAGLQESKNVQLKNLEASSSLADRIVGKSNKFASYISAFANHRGGHIYYGIDDSGIVEGETISEAEKYKIVNKVTNTINKIVWTQERSTPERGTQWDIIFEPVVDVDGNPVQSTFVIVVYVASYPGGVFTKEPESYYIVEGTVKRMNFLDWWTKFTGNFPKNTTVPPHVPRVCWSSKGNRDLFVRLSEKLVDHRDSGDMDAFNKLCTLATERFPERNTELIVKAGEVTIAYKRYNFSKAKLLLTEFAGLLSTSKDRSIFEVRMLLSECLVERSTRNYEVSYEIAQRGLQMMQLIPVGLCALWFYLEAAMNATCIAFAKQHELEKYVSLKASALEYLELAARTASSLEELQLPFRINDFQHKLRIYKAWVLLNCSITGEVAQLITPSCEDIEAAAGELASVSQSVLNGKALTTFRKIEYELAQCDLFRRRSEILQEDYVSNLNQACECGSRAQALASEHHFENMIDYASKRLDDLTEKLRGACVDNRTFSGFEY